MSTLETFFLPKANIVTITTDALASGSYWRSEPGLAPGAPTALAASGDYQVGPFNTDRTYTIQLLTGSFTMAESFAGADVSGAASGVTYDNTESGLTAENVQAAIDELAVDPGGSAAAISFNNSESGLAATNVQDAIDEVVADLAGSGLTRAQVTCIAMLS